MSPKVAPAVLRTCLAYAVFAGLWILLSDRAVAVMFRDAETISWAETYKGWAFVALTTVLLYFALREETRRWQQQVAKRAEAEKALEANNRALRMLIDCNQALMRATDEDHLLQEICRIATEVGGYRGAWVGYAENDEGKSVRIAAQAGGDPALLDLLKITWADEPRGRGPTGSAIRTGQPSAVQDVERDANFEPWRDLIPRIGHRALCALPLTHAGKTFGAVTVFSEQTDAFPADEIALLSELADDLAFGVTAMRTQAAHARAEGELKLFRRLVDHSTDAILVVDPETSQILDANDTACQRLGFTREELRAITVQEVSGRAPDQAVWSELMQRVQAGGGALIVEGRHRRRDGTFFPVEVGINLVEQDQKRFLIGIVRDITERKRFEEQQRRSEDMMATAQRIARFGSWELDLANPDLNSNPLRWSDETFRLFGYEPRSVEVSNELFFERIPSEDHERIVEAVGRAMRERTEYSLDHRIMLPDGEVRFVHEHARVFADERTGQLLRMVGTVHDITERRRAEEQLQRFLSMSPAVIYALKVRDGEFHLQWASENLRQLTGYSVDEPVDNAWWAERIHPDDRERVHAPHVSASELEHLVQEFRFRRKDGSYFWVHDEKRLLRDAQGKPVEVVGVWTDATDRVQLEEQLRQSQKMEAIGTLAGGVAHDFNNLLTVIQGHSSLLLAKAPTAEELNESLIEISEAAERAASLTRQLLIFSRKQFMAPTDLDLNEVVAHLTRMLRRIVGEDVALESELDTQLPLIHGDRGMIEQIVLNLAVNARDAMARGGQLTITTIAEMIDAGRAAEDPDATPGPCVRLSVRDTGCGIDPQALPHIFEPFFTTKAVGKGTGLGLATTYGIVKLHRGWITVASEVGRGTTFQIHFPAATGERAQSKPAPERGDLPAGRETILVVEDEALVRTLVVSLLTQLNYRVIEAPSGAAALEVWRENHDCIDLLLTDMVMPDGVTGRDLATRLLAEKPTLKVIYTSGYSPEIAGGDLSLTEGANFVQKPYTPQRLAKALRDNLDQR